MKVKGSVLIVVLGLLAILAVVGITFVTMSSIDRHTAANFALQTQFDLASGGAVEFGAHHLSQDLWELSPSNRDYTTMLMSGLNNNEPWDAPGTDDPWLANTVEPATAGTTPKNLSFGGRAVTLYTLSFRGTQASIPSDAPDNLGTGAANARNGIWLPELAFPYEGGLIRTSITIQDHASLINLNAHGNTGVTNSWPLADLVGWGYFISDVNGSNVSPSRLLVGDALRPGRWGFNKQAPGNPNIGEILFENPAAAVPWLWDGNPATHATEGDYPLNLDEEFDLRRIPKTGDPTFPSRVGGSNPIVTGLVGTPKLRLAYTTVGCTSEARGDWNSAGHLTAGTEGAWSVRKGDLNFDDPKAIYNALYFGRTCPINGETSWGGQFAANVAGFRDGSTGCGIKGYDLGTGPKAAAASRQPILSKVTAEMDGGPVNGQQPWKVTVQIISPWGNDTALQAANAGMTTQGMKLEVNALVAGTIPPTMQASTPLVITATGVMGPEGKPMTDAVHTITLAYQPANFASEIILDQLEPDDIALLALNPSSGICRLIFIETETRGATPPPNTDTTVLYVGHWAADAGNINIFTPSTKDRTSGIPIRFPRSVDGSGSNLPPRASAAGSPFKAIARLGDIDQILCPNTDSTVTGNKGSGDFWPWVTRVAKATANDLTSESNQKFNWDDTVQPGGSNVSRLNAANVLAVGGPWQDKLDNDGDGKMDNQDAGTGNTTTDAGRFAGPELRVAGKVNLNTGTSTTFQAMESGLRISGLSSLATASPRTVFKSIAQVRGLTTTVDNPNARGPLELRDEAFNRISNIASVRSDTYSIYGTVQYGTIDTAAKKFNVLRSRRFWALVDRSPSLAYHPLNSNFIHPRILNFQWMN